MFINLKFSVFNKLVNKFTIIFTTILGLILVTFVISRIMPVDPVLSVIGDSASAETYELTRKTLGLDIPMYKQLLNYVGNALTGDFGKSFLTNNDVMDDIIRVFPATVELAVIAMIISMILGIPLGIWAALNNGKWQDHLVRSISLFGNSVSIFWLGLMGLMIFYVQLDWTVGPGRLDAYLDDYETASGFIILESLFRGEFDIFINAIKHLILPASLLAYYKLAYISRMTRAFMLEELHQEYIITARAKGLSEFRIVWIHAFRNTLIPLITILGLSFATVLEGSTFIETIFMWPGLGFYLTNALKNADLNAIMGSTIIIGFIFICINLITDSLYKILDPRTKLTTTPKYV